jgi:protein-L-isoaspartate O-methyltransferase
MTIEATSRQFFDLKYIAEEDPWHFSSSAYEQDRYATTIRALSGRRYKRAFEPGCSIGVLTAWLSSICDEVHATDISPVAISRAMQRCRGLANVVFECAALPAALPEAVFDLIVLSEIGYYFDDQQLKQLTSNLARRVEHGGVVVGVHWLGVSTDHLLAGDQVHEILRATDGLKLEQSERHACFLLDRWSRV